MAEELHREVGDDRAADDQRRALDQIGPGAGLEPAGEDVDRGQRADDPAADGDAAQVEAEERPAPGS